MARDGTRRLRWVLPGGSPWVWFIWPVIGCLRLPEAVREGSWHQWVAPPVIVIMSVIGVVEVRKLLRLRRDIREGRAVDPALLVLPAAPPPAATLTWGDDRSQVVTSEPELRRLLERLHGEHARSPATARLLRADGGTMTIGLGTLQSLVTAVPSSGPPYTVGMGPDGPRRVPFTADGPRLLPFIPGGRAERIARPVAPTVPIVLAVAAMCDFFAKGRLREQDE